MLNTFIGLENKLRLKVAPFSVCASVLSIVLWWISRTCHLSSSLLSAYGHCCSYILLLFEWIPLNPFSPSFWMWSPHISRNHEFEDCLWEVARPFAVLWLLPACALCLPPVPSLPASSPTFSIPDLQIFSSPVTVVLLDTVSLCVIFLLHLPLRVDVQAAHHSNKILILFINVF